VASRVHGRRERRGIDGVVIRALFVRSLPSSIEVWRRYRFELLLMLARSLQMEVNVSVSCGEVSWRAKIASALFRAVTLVVASEIVMMWVLICPSEKNVILRDSCSATVVRVG